MLLISLGLLATGVAVGLLGYKMFKILLPLMGLVVGTEIGFVGFQAAFGSGAVSTTIAIFVAVATGMLLALLSFLFFEIAIKIYIAILGVAALTYLGVALGVGNNDIVMWLLALAGAVIGLSLTMGRAFSASFIIGITSFIGTALILSSVFLIAGKVSVEQLSQEGVLESIVRVVDQSFLWLFVWLAGSIIAIQAQKRLLILQILNNEYQFLVGKD